jgi:hypothetical protein
MIHWSPGVYMWDLWVRHLTENLTFDTLIFLNSYWHLVVYGYIELDVQVIRNLQGWYLDFTIYVYCIS